MKHSRSLQLQKLVNQRKHRKQNLTRRNFLATAGATALATSLNYGAESLSNGKSVKILGIACNARKGMTTAKAGPAALTAAQAVDPWTTAELIDLGGLSLAAMPFMNSE